MASDKDSPGPVIGLGVIVEEITARKQAAEELRHLMKIWNKLFRSALKSCGDSQVS